MLTSHRQIIPLYQRHGEAWAARRGQSLFEKPWLDRFLGLLPETPHILDLGCGSGAPMGQYLIHKGCRLTGIDTSKPLITMARAALPDAQWRVADMRGLKLGRRFSGILAWNSSFHLTPEDQRGLFGTFARHAAPGAALMFTSGPSGGEEIGALEGEPLYHASLCPQEYRDHLGAHGFDVIDHVAEDPDCRDHTVWLAKARTQSHS